MIRVTSISNTESDGNIVKISAFADTKEEVVSGAKFVGLDDDAVIDMGSSIITAAGDLAFMKSDGTWSWVSSGGGGGSVLIPKTITQNGTYDPTDDNADGYNEVTVNVEGGGGSTTYTGKTDPSPSQGHIGDYYIKYATFNELTAVTRSYQLEITKGLRGSSILTYVGAQEIQLIYDDGNGNEVNIRTLADFTRGGTTGNGGTTNPSFAFDGDTGGQYWEANPTPVTVYFSATVPTNYTLKKFVVWQRVSGNYEDVWADFNLIETIYTMRRTILSEKGLTVADWAGAGYGTEWDLSDISNPTEPIILGTYIKIGDTEASAEWITTTIKFGSDKGMLVEPVYQGFGACYVDVTGTSLYTDIDKDQFLNLFEVEANNTYALFVGESVGARRRASFFSGKTFADFEYYINTPSASSEQLIYGDGIWLAPYTAGTDDSGSGLIGRIIYTPNTNGVIVYGTDNAGSKAPAYCINLSKKVTQPKHRKAVHIVTHSTGGRDASLDVTEGYYDNEVFTPTGDTRTILYFEVQSSPINFNVCKIDYNIHSTLNWSVQASKLVISDGVEYNAGDYLPSWGYDTQNELIVYEKEATGAAILTTKTITQNGTYNPASDNADGYSQVVVNVSGGGGSATILIDEEQTQQSSSGGAISIDETATVTEAGNYEIVCFGYCSTVKVYINDVLQSNNFDQNTDYFHAYTQNKALSVGDVIRTNITSSRKSYLRALVFKV